MKRTLCLFALCFLLLLPAIAMANVEIATVNLGEKESSCILYSYAETDGCTYIYCPDCEQLLTYHEVDNTFTALPLRYVGGQAGTEEYAVSFQYLLEDEGKLYAVSDYGNAVYQIIITQEEAQLTGLFCPDVSWTNRRNKDSISPYLRGAAVLDGMLYLSVGYFGYFDEYLSSSEEYVQEFFCYDLTTGKRKVLNDTYENASAEIYAMISYHGKLICNVLTQRHPTSPAEEARFALLPPLPKEPILLYDPATNEYESIYTTMPNLFASNDGWYRSYSKQQDSLFGWDESNRIYLVREEEPPVLIGMMINESAANKRLGIGILQGQFFVRPRRRPIL